MPQQKDLENVYQTRNLVGLLSGSDAFIKINLGGNKLFSHGCPTRSWCHEQNELKIGWLERSKWWLEIHKLRAVAKIILP